MRLIYLSTDELNRALVHSWAVREGIPVECTARADWESARGSAVLIDTDHLPSGSLAAFLARPGDARPVAAHGYGPIGEELRGRGLEVQPRLRSRLLADLASAALSADCAPMRDTSDALTWVDLV